MAITRRLQGVESELADAHVANQRLAEQNEFLKESLREMERAQERFDMFRDPSEGPRSASKRGTGGAIGARGSAEGDGGGSISLGGGGGTDAVSWTDAVFGGSGGGNAGGGGGSVGGVGSGDGTGDAPPAVAVTRAVVPSPRIRAGSTDSSASAGGGPHVASHMEPPPAGSGVVNLQVTCSAVLRCAYVARPLRPAPPQFLESSHVHAHLFNVVLSI
jgi:hypothetical protein